MDNPRPEPSSILEVPVSNDNSLRIVLSRANDPQTCTFWVALYKSGGKGTSREFLKIQKLEDSFQYLNDIGLSEDGPLMLSDNTDAIHRQFFLLPQKAFAANPKAGKDLVLKTLAALVQKKSGLYLAPPGVSLVDRMEILRDLITDLAKLKTEEICLLTTNIGLNPLLSISLNVKESLRNTRDVWVFH